MVKLPTWCGPRALIGIGVSAAIAIVVTAVVVGVVVGRRSTGPTITISSQGQRSTTKSTMAITSSTRTAGVTTSLSTPSKTTTVGGVTTSLSTTSKTTTVEGVTTSLSTSSNTTTVQGTITATTIMTSSQSFTTTEQSSTSTLMTSTEIQRPPWPGTFAIAGSCDQSQCCCPTGNLVIKETTSTTLSISTTLSTSVALNCFFMAGPQTLSLAYPDGYNITVKVITAPYNIVLSSDGNTITLTDTSNKACSDVSTRTGAGR